MIHSDQLLQGYCAGPVRPVCLPWLCDVLVPDPMLLKRRDSFRGVVQILEPSSSRYHGQRSQMAQMDHNTTCPFRKEIISQHDAWTAAKRGAAAGTPNDERLGYCWTFRSTQTAPVDAGCNETMQAGERPSRFVHRMDQNMLLFLSFFFNILQIKMLFCLDRSTGLLA